MQTAITEQVMTAMGLHCIYQDIKTNGTDPSIISK